MRQGSWMAVAMSLMVGAMAGGCVQVREVAVQDLKQVAVVSWDAKGPVIYYSPELCVKVGRSVCAYERAQATMLVTRGPVPRQPNPSNPYDTSWISPRDILEADCRATTDLRGQARGAVEAAMQFYRQQGEARIAPNYPTGAQRASQILECLQH